MARVRNKKVYTTKEIEQIMIMNQDVLSLNQEVVIDSVDDGGGELLDFMVDQGPGPEELCVRDAQDKKLRDCVKNFLTPKEERVISLRFGLYGDKPMTLEEIGKTMGLTRERIRQIEVKGMKRLKLKLKLSNINSRGDL